MPSIVFEPELQEIQFGGNEIERVRSQYEKLPEQIEAVATSEFQERLKERLELLKARYENTGDRNRAMMVNAVQYFMDQENGQPVMNQIVVAMFLVAAHNLDSPNSALTLDQLNLQLREYDRDWMPYLKERMRSLEPGEEETTAAVVPGTETAEPTGSPFGPLIEQFSTYLSDVLRLEETTLERTEEDIEVLLIDFCAEREIDSLAGLKPRRIKSFLEGWFIRNMHPTEEDLETMIDSVAMFTKFLRAEEKLPPEACDEISAHLQDRDAILAHMET